MPLAPPRLSTTTCRFSDSDMPVARCRAMTSVPPPGANGTTMRTALTGYVCPELVEVACPAPDEPLCAYAAPATARITAAAYRTQHVDVFIDTNPSESGLHLTSACNLRLRPSAFAGCVPPMVFTTSC